MHAWYDVAGDRNIFPYVLNMHACWHFHEIDLALTRSTWLVRMLTCTTATVTLVSIVKTCHCWPLSRKLDIGRHAGLSAVSIDRHAYIYALIILYWSICTYVYMHASCTCIWMYCTCSMPSVSPFHKSKWEESIYLISYLVKVVAKVVVLVLVRKQLARWPAVTLPHTLTESNVHFPLARIRV